MLEAFKGPFVDGSQLPLLEIVIRLCLAAVFGGLVAFVYRRSRNEVDITPTFPPTLVLLAILIGMVTQVIGDNVALAFSLVGALAVVRDTQDTAFVMLSVVVGMAVGARAPWVAAIGLVLVAVVAILMKPPATGDYITGRLPLQVKIRIGLGHDAEALLGGTLDVYFSHRRMQSIETTKHGVSIDVAYEAKLREPGTPEQLVRALNRIEGVQSVRVERCPAFEE
jgi:uncharacterized membrane protein YhiD involved in acid resistance